MSKTKLDLTGLQEVEKQLEKVADFIGQKNGQQINLLKERIFTSGPFLHQDTETITEDESAKFERDNPELFAYLLSLDEKLGKIL